MVQSPEEEERAWANATAWLKGQKEVARDVHPLFQKAAERSLTINVLETDIEVRWPSQNDLKRAMASINRFRSLHALDEGNIPENVEQEVEDLADDFCQFAAELTRDPRLNYNAFRDDDYGMEMAAKIVTQTLQEIGEQKEAVRSFRPGTRGQRSRAAPDAVEKDAE